MPRQSFATYFDTARLCSIMVMVAGPKMMMNKPGKISKMVMHVSGNINQVVCDFGQKKRITKRRKLATKAKPIAVASKIGPMYMASSSGPLLSRKMSLLS